MSDGEIQTVRSLISKLSNYESSIIEECNTIYELIMDDSDYVRFSMETELGIYYNQIIENLLTELKNIGSCYSGLISTTYKYLKEQEERNYRERIERERLEQLRLEEERRKEERIRQNRYSTSNRTVRR